MEKKRELGVFLRILANTIGAVGLMAVLTSCGTSPGYSYTVGGTVSGMVGSGMVLQNNGGDDRSISADGQFSFNTPLTDGSAYDIKVKTPPTNPSQICSVSDGSGTINGAPVVNVVVSCVTGPTSVVTVLVGSSEFAYAANTDGTISAYNIDSSSGALNPICGASTGITCPSAGTYPTSITVDNPLDGKFAYAADTIDGTIWAYTIDQTYGTLTALETPVAAGTYPTSVVTVLVGSSEFAYATNMGSNNISAYTIQNDGTLVELANSPFQAGTSPSAISTVKLSVGEFAYVTNMNDNTIWFYSINSSNGNLTYLGEVATGTYPSSITVDQLGKFAYAANETSNNISVYTIDQTSGALTAGTAVAAGTSPTSIITVKLSGGEEFAYATNNTVDGTISSYTIDSSSGVLNPICGGSTGITCPSAGTYPASITVDPLGRFAYVANMGGGNILVYKINQTTGALQ